MPFVQDKEILCNPAGKAERCRYQGQFYQAVNPNVTGKKPQQNASDDQDSGLGSYRFQEASELQIEGAAQCPDLPGQYQKACDGLAENECSLGKDSHRCGGEHGPDEQLQAHQQVEPRLDFGACQEYHASDRQVLCADWNHKTQAHPESIGCEQGADPQLHDLGRKDCGRRERRQRKHRQHDEAEFSEALERRQTTALVETAGDRQQGRYEEADHDLGYAGQSNQRIVNADGGRPKQKSDDERLNWAGDAADQLALEEQQAAMRQLATNWRAPGAKLRAFLCQRGDGGDQHRKRAHHEGGEVDIGDNFERDGSRGRPHGQRPRRPRST